MDYAKPGDLISIRFSKNCQSSKVKILNLTLEGLEQKFAGQALESTHFAAIKLNQGLIFLFTRIERFSGESKTVWNKWDVFFFDGKLICISRHDRRIIERNLVGRAC